MIRIIMGSQSDQRIADKAIKILNTYSVEYELRVISAHRSLSILQDYMKKNDEMTSVYIAIAGKAAHLAGVIAGQTIKPVIGVPVDGSLQGLDALLSTVQMPSGIPVATVAIGAADNAALLAMQIIALNNPNLQNALMNHREEMLEKIRQLGEL
ncbi:5-(carboxyamino)imidazole ribonucleotide mutase [Erysipelothrix urinaevulpis]|uniref:5-(carboxyamino)imidazole ribonucleotide mutase n=1 Tax=Erysipelothrix urinaevulpis TaxID=2683717 RepID=UPI001F412321|nr:5-(carboxyamino)imidazole ribonucleotide mutase [Erysipelothrix urinaevulpis]